MSCYRRPGGGSATATPTLVPIDFSDLYLSTTNIRISAMEHPEVPLEQSQEDILHHAHAAEEKWILGVALTAALLAVIAAITARWPNITPTRPCLRISDSSDQWSYYQAKGIKANLLGSKIDCSPPWARPSTPKTSPSWKAIAKSRRPSRKWPRRESGLRDAPEDTIRSTRAASP